MPSFRLLVLSLVIVGWPTGSVRARAPQVKDDAQLFQTSTLSQANQEIKALEEQFHQKLVIETYKKVPKSFLTTWLKKKPDFGEWAKKHAGRSGLYVLICTESTPADIRILARGDMQRAFSPDLCQELTNRFGQELSAGRNDQGLLDTVASIRKNLTANLGPPPVFPWTGVFEIMLPILGIWLAILVLRAVVLRAESRLASPAPAGFGDAGSLPVAWFGALAKGRLRELFASRADHPSPKMPPEKHPSEIAQENLAPLHSETGVDLFEP
jgi:hypothetical protein